MNNETFIVRCPQCGAKNRVIGNRKGSRAVCGKCKTQLDLNLLFPDRLLNVCDTSFFEEVVRFNGPVVVDFTAPW